MIKRHKQGHKRQVNRQKIFVYLMSNERIRYIIYKEFSNIRKFILNISV